jgi:tRNA (adenine57-N1/adenine58-N1)-methyltransferase catalytic subunit
LSWNSQNTVAQEGDLVQLVGLGHKHFLLRLQVGGVFQSHRGVLQHDDMIGKAWGTQVVSHRGNPFFLLQPSLSDLLREIKRNTQILYPKDIGYLLVTMGIGPGYHVLEAGTGSGALTCAFAYAVGPQGHVTTYEAREPMHELAKRNAAYLGLDERVTFKMGNVADGFAETGVDALFYDLPNPFDYIAQARAALKPGGFFGTILPTTNQVVKLLIELRRNHFAFVDVCEIMLRFYKTEYDRFRPTDRMVAHTGFLIFARPVQIDEKEANPALLREAGLISEEDAKKAAAQAAAEAELDLLVADELQDEVILDRVDEDEDAG